MVLRQALTFIKTLVLKGKTDMDVVSMQVQNLQNNLSFCEIVRFIPYLDANDLNAKKIYNYFLHKNEFFMFYFSINLLMDPIFS